MQIMFFFLFFFNKDARCIHNIQKTQHKSSAAAQLRVERISPLLSLQHSCQADEGIAAHSDWPEALWHHRDGIMCQLGGGAFVLGRAGKELTQHREYKHRKISPLTDSNHLSLFSHLRTEQRI